LLQVGSRSIFADIAKGIKMAEKNFISSTTAARLKRVLSDYETRSPRPGRRGGRGNEFCLVRCTSATAVGGSGIGNQCYPATVLLAKSDETEPTELGDVWLTLLGPGSNPIRPIEGDPYIAVVSGQEELGNETKHRVFAVFGDDTQWLKVTGNLANGVYPAVISTFFAANQTFVDGNTTVQIRAGNAETLANGSRYLGCLATGLTNGTIGNASNATVYIVSTGNAAREAFYGNVVFAGNLGNAGNIACLTLNANGTIANGTGNVAYSYDVANRPFPSSQPLGMISIGLSNVAFPVIPASADYAGWVVSDGNQAFGGKKAITESLYVGTGNDAVRFAIGGNSIVAGSTMIAGSFSNLPLMHISGGLDGYLYATAGAAVMRSLAVRGNAACSTCNSVILDANASSGGGFPVYGPGLYLTSDLGNTSLIQRTDRDLVARTGGGNFTVVWTSVSGNGGYASSGPSGYKFGRSGTIGIGATSDGGIVVDLGNGTPANASNVYDKAYIDALEARIAALEATLATYSPASITVVESVDFGAESTVSNTYTFVTIP
jgi:hypothetical protein